MAPETIGEIRRLKEMGIEPKEIAKRPKLGVSTVYRYLQIREEGDLSRS